MTDCFIKVRHTDKLHPFSKKATKLNTFGPSELFRLVFPVLMRPHVRRNIRLNVQDSRTTHAALMQLIYNENKIVAKILVMSNLTMDLSRSKADELPHVMNFSC